MTRLRSPSLFWTFAGAFLVVLVIATVLQALVIVVGVRPLTSRLSADRARLAAQRTAQQIVAEVAEFSESAIREHLVSPRDANGIQLVYVSEDGSLVTSAALPRRVEWHLRALLTGERPPHSAKGRDARGPEGRPPFPPERGRFRGVPRIMERVAVSLSSGAQGEVVAITHPSGRFRFLPPNVPSPLLLFFPLAVLVAGLAGLVMFRAFVRRLRSLESLADRVAEGDLDARVTDPGRDEIGRLAARLNTMTTGLADAKAREEAYDQQRRQLLADVSHELATPLTSIRGYAETLSDPSVPVSKEERAAYVDNILAESQRMDLLIQDLFELTRLEAGATELVPERLDWSSLCRNVVERHAPRYRDRELSLRWDGGDQPAWVRADGRRLEQVLENLLTNGLRYVPRGGEVVLDMESREGFLRLTVTDDGPGIPVEDLPHVFERFYRATASRSEPGTGLGLAIVREIVARHGGSVSAERREPRGTRFVVELPSIS